MRIARHEIARAARGNFVFVGDAGFLAGRDARVKEAGGKLAAD
jgi:hypothetical protein